MTVATINPSTGEIIAPVQTLAEWAASADAAYHVAERLVQSSFVPASFAHKPVEAAAAILAGQEVGLQPMASLRAFDVIQGQAAPRAMTLRAIVQSAGHEIEIIESTDTRCTARGRRRNAAEWQTVRWTIDRAKQLGVTGKDNWKKQPGAMLVARATSELCRLIAADAILGIPYSSEEIVDGAAPEPPGAGPAEPAPTRKLSRRKPAEAAVTVEQVADELAEPGITDPQRKKMHALLGELGLTDRDDYLRGISAVIGRTVESSNDLTKAEAIRVIDSLESRLPQVEEPAGPEALIAAELDGEPAS